MISIAGSILSSVFNFVTTRSKQGYDYSIETIKALQNEHKDDVCTYVILYPTALVLVAGSLGLWGCVDNTIEAVGQLERFPIWWQELTFYVVLMACGLLGVRGISKSIKK